MNKPAVFVFGNPIPRKYLRKAERTFRSYASRFHYDAKWKPTLSARPLPGAWEHFGVRQIVSSPLERSADGDSGVLPLPERDSRSVILGTIRMGYGHYRIALAIASAARSLGLTPYWLDFLAFPGSAATRVLHYLNGLYTFGSRLSQKFKLFNHFVWERITSEAGLKLGSTVRDRELSRIFAPVIGDLDRSVPFVATHPWTGHAAIHAGMERVVTVVPDNYPLAFHLVEGSLHAVQTPSNYLGYRTLRNMGDSRERPLSPMGPDDIRYAGHFVDHEIVDNVETDTEQRFRRLRDRRPRRLLLSMGGAGAQRRRFTDIIRYCRPAVDEGRAVILVNMGDHREQWLHMKRQLDSDGIRYTLHERWDETQAFAEVAQEGEVTGIHIFLFDEIFPAVYATNMLMRAVDLLVTKPSELSFYPIPKLFIRRVGSHEAWGAMRGAEIGDGTLETQSFRGIQEALQVVFSDDELLRFYGNNILNNHRIGVYNGAYQAIRMAVGAANPV